MTSGHEMQETIARALCENSTRPCNEHSADAGIAVSALVLAGYLQTGGGAGAPDGGSPLSAGAVNTAPSSPTTFVLTADRTITEGAAAALHAALHPMTGGGAGDTPPATSAAPPGPAAQAGEAIGSPTPPPPALCPNCASMRWVSVSLDEGWTRRAQCVPCGAIYPGTLGPGWRAMEEAAADAVTLTDDGAGAPPAAGGDPAGEATSTPAPSSPFPRRFRLYRHEDPSGVSGTQWVAEGIQFIDGYTALRWFGEHPCTVPWDNIERIIAVHGHGGLTEIVWLDGGE